MATLRQLDIPVASLHLRTFSLYPPCRAGWMCWRGNPQEQCSTSLMRTIFTITVVARIFLLESARLGILSYCKCKEIEMQTHSTPAVGTRDTGTITHSTHTPLCSILGLPGNSLSITNVMKVDLFPPSPPAFLCLMSPISWNS